MFERLLQHLLRDYTVKRYMYVALHSIYITLATRKARMDVYFICGQCGVRVHWPRANTRHTHCIPVNPATVHRSLTFNYASANAFFNKKKKQKQVIKERRKRKSVLGTIS